MMHQTRRTGRPPENDVRLGQGRFVRLEQDVDDLLVEIAKREDRPIGRVIRVVLRAGLEAMGETSQARPRSDTSEPFRESRTDYDREPPWLKTAILIGEEIVRVMREAQVKERPVSQARSSKKRGTRGR